MTGIDTITAFKRFVNNFTPCCTSDEYHLILFKKVLELLKEHEELKSRHKILVDECDKMYYTLKEKNKTIEELEDDLATTKDMLNHYLNGNE